MSGFPQVETSAQTFTVGVGGTLEQIDVMVQNKNATEPLTMRILGTMADGLPDATTVLATMSLPPSAIPTVNNSLQSFILPPSQRLTVHQGQVLAIAVSEDTLDTSGLYGWWGSESSTYAGGGFYSEVNNQNVWSFVMPTEGFSAQSGFRTWVDTPEPSFLGPILLAGLLVGQRRQKPISKTRLAR